MAENAQIDDELFDRIHQAMLIRVTDKFPNVRIQAALAMTRLQQPQDPDCPTINGLLIFIPLTLNLTVSKYNQQKNSNYISSQKQKKISNLMFAFVYFYLSSAF